MAVATAVAAAATLLAALVVSSGVVVLGEALVHGVVTLRVMALVQLSVVVGVALVEVLVVALGVHQQREGDQEGHR